MEDERDAFYVVRKGDIIGIYKSFSDCQAQAGFSVNSAPFFFNFTSQILLVACYCSSIKLLHFMFVEYVTRVVSLSV